MKTFRFRGYKVMVFEGYNGKQMFINNPNGEQVWAHKFIGDAFEQAKRIINGNYKAKDFSKPQSQKSLSTNSPKEKMI